MADDLRLHLRFPLRREALCRALYQIRVHYRDTPYHNFRHAFDVSQCVYLFVRSCPSLALFVTSFDVGARPRERRPPMR